MKSSLPNCFKKLSARGPPQIMATWKCGVRKASHNDIDDSLVWNQHITWWLVTNRRSACSVIAVHLRLMTESLWSSCFHRKFITTQSNFTSFVAPGASISFVDCRITSRLTLLEVSSDRSGNLQLYLGGILGDLSTWVIVKHCLCGEDDLLFLSGGSRSI